MRVKGEGPLPSHVMFVGEGPGVQESLTGRPFVETAPAGAELTRYCGYGGVPWRDEIYITNLVKEWPLGSLKKKHEVTPEDVARDEWELRLEIQCCKPQIIVALGRHAARWLMGKDVDMESVHGVLFDCMVGDHLTFVLPVYHPAAGLHQPDLAAKTAYGFARLGEILKTPSWEALVWKPAPPGVYTDMLGAPGSKGLGLAIPLVLGVDTEGTPSAPFSFSMSPKLGHAVVEPFTSAAGYSFIKQCLEKGVGPVLTPVFHNFMWDTQVLEAVNIHVPDDGWHDTMVMAFLLGIEPQALKALAYRHLGMKMLEFDEVATTQELQFGKTGKLLKKTKKIVKALGDIEPGLFRQYAGADADATRGLFPILWDRVQAAGLGAVYEMDRSVLPLYARMESVGLPVDMPHFKLFGEWLDQQLSERTADLQVSWPDLNPASAKQVSHIMFSHLGLKGGKKTPGGQWSTNDKILQAIKDTHPFVGAIIEWRELAKLKGTFVDSLPSYVGADQRLRYRLLPTRVVSGRVAAKDPNVLALPKHSELGKRFRAGIRASAGCQLGSWDFNQIELRVLAIDSGSQVLRDIFIQGVDLHTRTAAKIFGVPDDRKAQDDSLHRLPAKTCNFSIIMGTTGIGLAEQMRKNQYPWPELAGMMGASLKEFRLAQEVVCQGWVDTIIKDWGIAPYISEKHAQARRYGYVTDMWGRRRYLPSVLSPNKQIREGALRQAQSFGPQAGARGIYKQVVAKVWREVIRPLQKEGRYIEPLMDLHDDLLLEFESGLAGLLGPLVKSYFEGTVEGLPIPILCSAKVGERWSQL